MSLERHLEQNAPSTEAPPSHIDIDDATEFKPGLRFYAAFGSICVNVFTTMLDALTLAAALPIISLELNGQAIEAFWAGTSFLLSSTVSQLTFGTLSETFGRKHLIIVALVFFLVGSVIAALARDFAVLIAGRTVQGIGGGGVVCLTEILICDLVPLRQRGTYFSYQSAVSAVGSVAGPVVGGALAESIGWRWIFWINVPLCVVGIGAVAVFLKLEKVPGKFATKVAQIDWTGIVMMTAAATATLVAISWGDIMFPWTSWQSLVPLILGLLGLVAFLVYEGTVPVRPVVRLSIFSQRTALVSYIGTVIHGIILWCLLYYIPLYYQCVLGYSATMSGVATFPETFTIAPAAIVVGILASRWGYFRWAIWTGWSLSVLGMGLLYMLGTGTTVWQWVLINVVPGVGLGMLFNSLAYGTLAAAEEKDAAYAASMYTFCRAFGQSVGVATGGALLQSRLRIELRVYPSLADQAMGLAKEASALVEHVKSLPKDSPDRIMIVAAYAESLKIIWAVMAGLAGLALLASLLTRQLNVNRPHQTDQGLRGKREVNSA